MLSTDGLYDWSPGFIEIEATVIKWLNEIMGFPAHAGGILTSGGSVANFEAIVTARSEKLGEQILNGTVYCSDQAHHSVLKAATLAGIPRSNVRKIETDETFRIKIDALENAILGDLQKGLRPFLIVGNGGTTSTGAIDPLNKLSEIAKKHRLWFHVDAAWAGAFRLTKKGKALFLGIDQADSITFDPHKALFLPFGCGALLVKEVSSLKRAHSFEADYLPSEHDPEKDLLNPSQISAELSRTLRGLQVWLPLKMLGVQPFVEALEEKLELTSWITTELKKHPKIEVITEPQTSIVAFRILSEDGTHDQKTKRVLDYINSKKLILLSGASLKGKFSIRVVPFAHRTHKNHVELTLSYIQEGIERV